MSRGDGRESIFLSDRDYQKFYFLMQEMVETYDVECRDICLIPNHFHLTLFHERENLSDAMQFLKGVQRPEDWPWSAYRYFVGLAEPGVSLVRGVAGCVACAQPAVDGIYPGICLKESARILSEL